MRFGRGICGDLTQADRCEWWLSNGLGVGYAAGIRSISEIFDGEPPHRPRGAPSQAWSVATVLEAWWLIHSQLNPWPG